MAPQTSYFTDASMVRQVHRELAVRLRRAAHAAASRPTHPVAFAGFFAHTGALDAPYERLASHRAGDRRDHVRGRAPRADRADPARARHAPPRARRAGPSPPGRFPAGTPYAADDPELLLGSWRRLSSNLSLLVYE